MGVELLDEVGTTHAVGSRGARGCAAWEGYRQRWMGERHSRAGPGLLVLAVQVHIDAVLDGDVLQLEARLLGLGCSRADVETGLRQYSTRLRRR